MSIDLDAIQARADAATEGPWEAQDCGHDCCFWVTDPSDRDGQLAGFKTAADASLFAHARTDVPALLAYARDLEARIGRVRELHIPVMEDGNEVGCSMCDWEHPEGYTWPCGTLAATDTP